MNSYDYFISAVNTIICLVFLGYFITTQHPFMLMSDDLTYRNGAVIILLAVVVWGLTVDDKYRRRNTVSKVERIILITPLFNLLFLFILATTSGKP